ncbi:DinB family protein [Paenibacillus aurantius]|uniref:DinB family protein n=1 Tax=Paenibacillus aurantius TaxID=2918900 RepID=A0AA96LHZ7_9BACL|nr:DinB family protein [Paenibacillus aurantius]WNQ12346.1 DinB family protein [Paenibacillus aurantius]
MPTDRETIEIFRAALAGYTEEELRRVTAEGVWSLGQLYNHLVLASLEYLDFVEACAAAEEEQPLGKTEFGEELYRLGGFPPVRIKLPGDIPDNTETADDHRRGLEEVMRRMQDWEGRVDEVNPNLKVRHGGFGWLNASEWLALVGMHFRHHLRQKEELERALGR